MNINFERHKLKVFKKYLKKAPELKPLIDITKARIEGYEAHLIKTTDRTRGELVMWGVLPND